MASKQIMTSTLPRKITIAISFSTKPARIDLCFDTSPEGESIQCSSHKDAPKKGLISLTRMRREMGASKNQEHPNGDFPSSTHFPETRHTDTSVHPQTPSTDTTQHPENAAQTQQVWEEVRDQRDPKTTRQDSKSSQYEQHSTQKQKDARVHTKEQTYAPDNVHL